MYEGSHQMVFASNCFVDHVALLIPQRVNGIQERGLVGWIETEEDADDPGKTEGDEYGRGRHDGGPAGDG